LRMFASIIRIPGRFADVTFDGILEAFVHGFFILFDAFGFFHARQER
jgi:hypothetical protein